MEKRLFISSSFMLEDLFCTSFFIIQYILGKKIKAIILVNLCAIGYSFINEKFVEVVYQMLEIEP